MAKVKIIVKEGNRVRKEHTAANKDAAVTWIKENVVNNESFVAEEVL